MNVVTRQIDRFHPAGIVAEDSTGQAEGVRLREWNPATAPEAELQAWLRSYNSALAVDLPTDPPWQIDRLRDYLTVTMPGERRLTWLVEDESHPGDVLGYGRLLVMEGLGVSSSTWRRAAGDSTSASGWCP